MSEIEKETASQDHHLADRKVLVNEVLVDYDKNLQHQKELKDFADNNPDSPWMVPQSKDMSLALQFKSVVMLIGKFPKGISCYVVACIASVIVVVAVPKKDNSNLVYAFLLTATVVQVLHLVEKYIEKE